MVHDRPDECYDHPRYWDLAFSDETQFEADFIRAAADRYCEFPVERILEPACGGGRQVVELASRGFSVIGYDLNAAAVRYTRQRLARRRLTADVHMGDLCSYRARPVVDLAHCLVNSFRHLQTESAALQHLQCTADSLRKGGLYLLGLHLLPPDAEEYDCERWTIQHKAMRITTTVRVLEFNRRTRLETLRFSLRVNSPTADLRLRSDHQLRIYKASQMRALLKKMPQFQLLDVFDFCYDINDPLKLNDNLGDTVLILQKR